MISHRRVLAGGAAALALPTAAPAMTQPPRPANAEAPVLVRDTGFRDDRVRHFRSAADLAAAARARGIDVTGLADLAVSGSAQFSVPGWAALRRGPLAGALIAVDLRQESHGFLNGAAVTWAAADDWANVGMTHDQAMAIEADRLAWLARQTTVAPPTATAFKQGGPATVRPVAVRAVADERATVTDGTAAYRRLTVTDHLRPDDGEVDRFLAAVAGPRPGTKIHVHCRGGDGRTTSFLAMLDMLANADRVDFAAIVARQASVSPFYDLADVKTGPKAVYYRERLAFLARFHRYAADRARGDTRPWSVWAAA